MGLVSSVVRGKVAGAVGTAAMDSLWYFRYRRKGGEDSFASWEFASSVKDWSNAPAPAQFGKKVVERFAGREMPPESAAAVTNVVHWATGIGWGALYGLAASRPNRSQRLVPGLFFGTAVWASSYVVLPLAKVYRPIWEYDADDLWEDLTAHLVYGAVTAATFRLLSR